MSLKGLKVFVVVGSAIIGVALGILGIFLGDAILGLGEVLKTIGGSVLTLALISLFYEPFVRRVLAYDPHQEGLRKLDAQMRETKQAIKKFDETTVRTNVNQIASTVWRIEKQQEDLKNWVLALGDLENYGAAIK